MVTTLLITEPERPRALGALEGVERRAAIELVLEPRHEQRR